MSLDWYKWFPARWQASRKVQRMTLAERGLYHEMLDEAWNKGPLPDDPARVADMLGLGTDEVMPCWARVRMAWVETEGGITSPFLEEIREQVGAYLGRQSAAGRASAAARAAAKATAVGEIPTTVNHGSTAVDGGSTMVNQAQPIEEKRREEKRERLAAEAAASEIALKLFKEYPRKQTCDGVEKSVPPSTSGVVVKRFIDTCRHRKVDPLVLDCAVRFYITDALKAENFLPALQVLLGKEKCYWENHIEKATTYLEKRKAS